jgi:hypothetical protein
MIQRGKQLQLSVPGLSEKRPSVLRGDQVREGLLEGDSQPIVVFILIIILFFMIKFLQTFTN